MSQPFITKDNSKLFPVNNKKPSKRRRNNWFLCALDKISYLVSNVLFKIKKKKYFSSSIIGINKSTKMKL